MTQQHPLCELHRAVCDTLERLLYDSKVLMPVNWRSLVAFSPPEFDRPDFKMMFVYINMPWSRELWDTLTQYQVTDDMLLAHYVTATHNEVWIFGDGDDQGAVQYSEQYQRYELWLRNFDNKYPYTNEVRS